MEEKNSKREALKKIISERRKGKKTSSRYELKILNSNYYLESTSHALPHIIKSKNLAFKILWTIAFKTMEEKNSKRETLKKIISERLKGKKNIISIRVKNIKLKLLFRKHKPCFTAYY